MRPSGRKADELRTVTIVPNYCPQAEGSCFICVGETHVICTASLEDGVPHFLRNSGSGWITAEYGMLPRATAQRTQREAARGKQTGRTVEIQRLIGRCLRSVVDLKGLGERQIKIDCDVIRADGGTRTASITGAFVAMYLALQKLVEKGHVKALPITDYIAAISCGLYKGTPVLDLDYHEDSSAEADANFILTRGGNIVEIQGTAEHYPFSKSHFHTLFEYAEKGVEQLVQNQLQAIYRS